MRVRHNKTRDPKGILFYVLATILGLLLIGLIIAFVVRLNQSYYRYVAEPNDILRTINRGDYADAWLDVQNNRAQGVTEEKDPAYRLPYAVMDYYIAASYYTVYQEEQDPEKAALYREKMETAYDSMGELQYLAEEIDACFEVERQTGETE